MVGEAPEGGVTTSSLFSLVPRQLMLESSAIAADVAEKMTKKRRKGEEQNEKARLPAGRASLLRTIAIFLESSGFIRTLAALRSEANLEIDDASKAPGLDLEEIVCKYLELSKDHVLESISGPEQQDAQIGSPKKEKGSKDQSEEPISKKKKKKAKGGAADDKAESDVSAYENGVALSNQQVEELLRKKASGKDHRAGGDHLPERHMESKDKRGKKSKKVCSAAIETVGIEKLETLVEETPKDVASLPHISSGLLEESNVRTKDKKKKKNKLTSDLQDGAVSQVAVEASQEEKGKCKELESKGNSQVPNVTSENLMGESNFKSKDKKKRKHKLTIESSSGDCAELQNGSKSEAGKKEKSTSHDIEEDAKESTIKIENGSSLENTSHVDKKLKWKKKSPSEEAEVYLDNDAAGQASKQGKPDYLIEQDIEETKRLLDGSSPKSGVRAHGKKRKREKEEDSEKSSKTLVNQQSEVPKDAKEIAEGSGQNGIKEQQQINGDLDKNQVEGDGSLKSKKVEGLAEPKTVNAFKRVKINEVKFADERLQDNSYWAKDGADSGYGAKAQEILGQVRGRDFRHEKTKKKRGSYRGGLIDFESHSVKFKYSDEED